MSGKKIIGMWSGPRNISTALMRSFENRVDTTVTDEPFYAFFLRETGTRHPMYQEVINSYDTSWNNVADVLTGSIPNDKDVWYQKLMTHHWVNNQPLKWISSIDNCFLIRNPKKVILSYLKIHDEVSPELLGLPQQLHIFNHAKEQGKKIPIVIDSGDILKNPKLMLRKLCDLLGIQFSNRMLKWPKGFRDSDGIWKEYWYGNVIKTTSFSKPSTREEEFPDKFLDLLDECMHYYRMMKKYKIN